MATTKRDGGGGLTADDVVRASLIIAWAAAGVTLARRSSALGRIVLAGASVAGVAYLAGAMAAMKDGDNLAVVAVHVLAVGLLPAIGLHFVLSLADGVLGSRGRVATVAVGYAGVSVAGVIALAADRSMPGWVIWLEATIAVLVGAGPAHRRYLESTGLARQRLQWLGCAVTVAGEVALVTGALRILVDWPGQAAVVAAAGTVLVPLALIASATPLVTQADRLLVTTVSATGLTGVVVGVYLVIVIGLGRTPTRLRAVAARAVDGGGRRRRARVPPRPGAAGRGRQPARLRRAPRARRGAAHVRQPADARPIPMDELLLQLAESLRKTHGPAPRPRSGPVRRDGSSGRCRCPTGAPASSHRAPEEQPVVTRAGVSATPGSRCGCPRCSTAATGHQLRVAPISHSGELLGLIVVERPPTATSFTEEDDRVLTELARQVGLALHNVQLDSALQASLDEVRQQADELQASRARIVATGDAERRKIERNLHDGAQQHLVALAVNLRLAKDIVADDPGAAAEMLDALGDDVKETIQELRDLAHGIYPPLLMDSGLPEALRAAGRPEPARRSPSTPTASAATRPRSRRRSTSAAWRRCRTRPSTRPRRTVDVAVWEDATAPAAVLGSATTARVRRRPRPPPATAS